MLWTKTMEARVGAVFESANGDGAKPNLGCWAAEPTEPRKSLLVVGGRRARNGAGAAVVGWATGTLLAESRWVSAPVSAAVGVFGPRFALVLRSISRQETTSPAVEQVWRRPATPSRSITAIWAMIGQPVACPLGPQEAGADHWLLGWQMVDQGRRQLPLAAQPQTPCPSSHALACLGSSCRGLGGRLLSSNSAALALASALALSNACSSWPKGCSHLHMRVPACDNMGAKGR